MKIGIFEKKRFIFFISLFMLMTALAVIKFVKDSNSADPGEAIIEYRNLLKRSGKYQPNLLKKALYRQLKHKDPMVRRNVAEVLGELNEPGTLGILWRIITDEKDADVRLAAAEAIHVLGGESTLKYMVRLLNDKDILVRSVAASSFGYFGDKTMIRKLEEAFRKESNNFNRLTIASSMAQLGDEKKARFIENSMLNSLEPEVRRHAAYMLCIHRITSNIKILKRAMVREKDPYVKVCIACALANRGEDSGVNYLRDIVSKSEIVPLRFHAAQALSEVEDFEYVYPYLVELLKDKDPGIREDAIEELVNFKNPQLVHILGDVLLNDESVIVREIAAWVLGELRNESALSYLEKGLYDDSPFVRTGAVAAMYKFLKGRSN